MTEIDANWKLAMVDVVATRCASDADVENFDGVFVATKDPSVLNALKDSDRITIPVTSDAITHRYGRGFSTEDLVKGQLNRTQEAFDAFSDVDILSRCKGIFSLWEEGVEMRKTNFGKEIFFCIFFFFIFSFLFIVIITLARFFVNHKISIVMHN